MKQNKQECILYYEAEADKYDSKRFKCPCRKLVDLIYKQAIYDFIKKSDCILDAGAGTGRFTKYFAANGHKVLAMDTSESMLENTRRKITEMGLEQNVTLIQGDIEEIPLEDNSVDAIVCIHVLVHFESPEKAVRELSRVLKPGGLFVFELANHIIARWYNKLRSLLIGGDYFSFTDHYRSYKDIKKILESSNITVVGRKRIKKIPKFILHTFLCKFKISLLFRPLELLERMNFGFLTIICGEKKL